jgi:hypothetical protein
MKTTKDLLLDLDHLNNDQLEDLYLTSFEQLSHDPMEKLNQEEKNELEQDIRKFHFLNELHRKRIDIALYSASIFTLAIALVDFNKDYMFHMFNLSLIAIGFLMTYFGLEIMFPTLEAHDKLVRYYKKMTRARQRVNLKSAA